MSSAKYPVYKDSGVEWLDEVPADWQVKPLRYLAAFKNGESFKPSDWSDQGTPIVRIQNLNGGDDFNFYDRETDERYHVKLGDLLFGWSGNRGTSFGPFIWKREGLHYLNQHIFKVSANGCDSRWLYWCLKAVTFYVEQEAHGIIGMVHITKGKLGAIKVPLPPQNQQLAIASFLDVETTKIDALVAEQEHLVSLLKEKRHAEVSQAVTRGFDPNVPMKDSGVEWIGRIPQEWDILPIRFLFRFVKRQNGDTLDVLSVYRDYGVIHKDSRNDNINKTPDDLSSYQTVRPGDLVVNKMKSWQGSLGISEAEGITSPDYAVFAPTHDGCSEYLNWLLRCKLLPDVYRSLSNGIRPDQWRLEPEKFKDLRIPYPPKSEQNKIARQLRSTIVTYDALAAEAERAIALLRERRSALISAVVTGKFDVRGLAPVVQEAA